LRFDRAIHRELAQQILDVLHDRFAPFFVQFRVMGLIGGTDTDEGTLNNDPVHS